MAITASGYSGAPLVKKLGIKDGFRIRLVDAPTHYFDLFDGTPPGIRVLEDKRIKKDFIHLFATDASGLRAELAGLKNEIEPNGMIWVSWPKAASKVATDVCERVVREAAIAVGLVDVKVCAVDDVWSGLKLVIPVKDRGQAPRSILSARRSNST
jgi:hypothetical protein